MTKIGLKPVTFSTSCNESGGWIGRWLGSGNNGPADATQLTTPSPPGSSLDLMPSLVDPSYFLSQGAQLSSTSWALGLLTGDSVDASPFTVVALPPGAVHLEAQSFPFFKAVAALQLHSTLPIVCHPLLVLVFQIKNILNESLILAAVKVSWSSMKGQSSDSIV
jgi:hypothetical protein